MTPTERWLTALEARHFSDLTFQEVSRSLRALSATYVERRGRIREGAALSGAGKRAAFALFYGPLHYLLVREIVVRSPALKGSADIRTAIRTPSPGGGPLRAADINRSRLRDRSGGRSLGRSGGGSRRRSSAST